MKYIILYNAVSGGGKALKVLDKAIKIFHHNNIKVDAYKSLFQGDLKEKAKEFSSIYDCIIAMGGDGTINEVVNGILESSNRISSLGIIRAGTANDIAALYKIPKSLKKSIKLIINNKPRLTDMNKINDHYFVYVCAAGMFTKVTYTVDRKNIKKYGYFAYLTEATKDYFESVNTDKYKYKVSVTHTSGYVSDDYMLILGLTGKRVGGMNLFNFSIPKYNDGLLELRLFKYVKLWKIIRLFSFILSFGKKAIPDTHLKSSMYVIETTDEVAWNIDGEFYTKGSVKIEVEKEALPVIVSKKVRKFY
jgi:YegS/Rv2252/BmrU family lipid kinase